MADAPLVAETDRLARRERWEERTAWPLTVLAITSLLVFVLTAALDVNPGWEPVVDWVVWGCFVIDYVVRLTYTARRDRLRWMREHPIDFLAVLLPMLRVFRVIAILGRLVLALQRSRAERVLVSTVGIAVITTITAAAAVLDVERDAPGATITSFGDAIWWALVTVTTVGYGDFYPVTPQGRALAAVLMFIGIGVVGSVIGAVTSRVMSANHG